jgi:hypothetical protein
MVNITRGMGAFSVRRSAQRLRILVTFMVAFLASCGDDGNLTGYDEHPEQIDGIYVNHTDPAALVSAHAEAVSERNLWAYEALVVRPAAKANVFGFCPMPAEAPDFPRCEGGCWGYDDEMEMISNMFDSTYSSPFVRPLQSLEMDLVIQEIHEMGGGTYAVDCAASVFALAGPNDGFASQTHLVFSLPSIRECFRIERIEEIAHLRHRSTWASIKAQYHSDSR